jgi:hypothetical protein
VRVFVDTANKIDRAKNDHETRPQTIERLVNVALKSIKEVSDL